MKAERPLFSDLILEQYALGELSEAERAKVEAALGSEPSLRPRLEELRRSDEAILREYPSAEIAASIRRRMLVSQDRLALGSRRLPSGLIFSAAAALLFLVGGLMARGVLFPSAEELTRPKGGSPGLAVYRKTAVGASELGDGASAAQGDVLQLKYGAGTARYGAIYSLDGRGTVTRHLPESASEDRSPELAAGGAALGEAYQLDDAPLFERFFIVTSERPFELATLDDALRDLAKSPDRGASGAPTLPRGLAWKSLILRKPGSAP
jgi:hypothetical protein